MQKTLVILKPSCLQRGLVGEVTKRFEQKGLRKFDPCFLYQAYVESQDGK